MLPWLGALEHSSRAPGHLTGRASLGTVDEWESLGIEDEAEPTWPTQPCAVPKVASAALPCGLAVRLVRQDDRLWLPACST
jgi:hypothetical protein